MLENLIFISVTIFILFSFIYIMLVLKEKLYLNNNIIFIDNLELNPDDLGNIDIKHFMLGTMEIKAGDEVKIITNKESGLRGTILGANKSDNIIAIANKKNGVTNLNIRSIKKIKIISRYGKFFTKF